MHFTCHEHDCHEEVDLSLSKTKMMKSATDVAADTLKATMNRQSSNATSHIRRRSSIIATISLLSLVSTASALWGEKRLLAHQPLYLSRSSKRYDPSKQIISLSAATGTVEGKFILYNLRGGGDEAIDESSIEDINNNEGGNDVSENASEPNIVIESSVVETNDENANDQATDNSAGDETIQEDDSNEEVEEEISNDDIIINDDITSVDEVNESTILSDEADVLENNSNNSEEDENIDEKSAEDEEDTEDTTSENVDVNDNSNTSIIESESSEDDEYDEDSTDEETTTPPLDVYEIQSNELRTSASDKRALAKTHHDDGNLKDAAIAFREAAMLLDEAMEALSQSASANENSKNEEEEGIAVERATCRLHEALCLLKDGRPGDCVEACTDVLEDDVTVVPLDDDDNKNSENDSDDNLEQPKQAAVVKIIPATTATTGTTKKVTIPAQIRARAHHRRAKARLALGDLDGALEDARSAAFMGDRNAVQFYGRLMREGSATATGGELSSSPTLPMGMGAGSNPFLDGMLGGMGGNTNPFMPSPGAAPSSDFSSSLLSSLLTGNSGSDSGSANPFGLFGELLSPPDESEGSKRKRGKKKKGGMDNLAKSVVKNVMKRIEDKDTQETICGYLQSTNKQQIMQISTMAGVPMKEESARRLAGIANGITPKGIRKGLRRVKRGLKVIKTGRKILKVLDKYKPFIIVAVILYWARSAVLAPYPVSKKKLAQQAAFGLLIMPTQRNGADKIIRGTLSKFFMTSTESDADSVEDDSSGIEEEIEKLQQQLTLIEALEERNKAQIESFVDEEDQWNSMEAWEQELLSSKETLTQQMEQLTEELVLMFMGEKSRNG